MISTYQLKKILKDTSLGPTWSKETAEVLKVALKDCDEHVITAILSLDVDINFEFAGGDTLLALVIRYANTTNWAKTARLLIDRQASIDVIDSRGIPIISSLVSHGEHELVQDVIHMGAQIEIRGKNGETPLITAIHFRQLKCVEVLLNLGADPNAATPDGNTALIWVASRPSGGTNQSRSCIKMLLAKGADINRSNRRGYTPLMTASIIEEPEVVQYLLDAGADFKRKDKKEENALIKAVDASCEQVVSVLLKQNFDLDDTDKYGCTALMSSHRATINDKLLQAGANPNIRSHSSNTALHFQVKQSDISLVQSLIEYGAHINAVNHLGDTPLHLAVRARNVDIVYVLINAGSDINIVNLKGVTLIHELLVPWDFYFSLNLFDVASQLEILVEMQDGYETCRRWSHRMVRMMINNGAPATLENEESVQPLMLAALLGDVEMVDILLENGADFKIVDAKDRNLMCYAAKSGSLALVQRLWSLGCETNSRDADGCYPIYYAAHFQYNHIVRYLIVDFAFLYCAFNR